MDYHFSKEIKIDFDVAVNMVFEELKKEGFGVLTDIDVKETLKKKIDMDFRRYRILGACNPPSAYKALTYEPNIGLMLPCNVVVQQIDDSTVRISAIDPLASMMAVENNDLAEVANHIREKMMRIVDRL